MRWSTTSCSIVSDLNREQRDLCICLLEQASAEGAAPYFTAETLSRTLDGPLRRNPQAIDGHLAVLAARGLVIPLSLEEQDEATGASIFGNAYRLPRREQDAAENTEPQEPGDQARTRELERLAAGLEQDRDGS